MGLTYLVDTNIVSEIMRPQPAPQVEAAWRDRVGGIAISAVTWHELLTGVLRLPDSKRRQAFTTFLYEFLMSTMPILAYDHEAARWHARERARLMQAGQTPPFADGQIAAVAAVNNLILVTRNTHDFAAFSGLRLENWFQPNT